MVALMAVWMAWKSGQMMADKSVYHLDLSLVNQMVLPMAFWMVTMMDWRMVEWMVRKKDH